LIDVEQKELCETNSLVEEFKSLVSVSIIDEVFPQAIPRVYAKVFKLDVFCSGAGSFDNVLCVLLQAHTDVIARC